MLIEIDEFTTLNDQVPIAWMEEVDIELANGDITTGTKVVFAIAGLEPLYSRCPKAELAQLLNMPRYTMPDPPLAEDKMPREGESTADYLNRIMP